MKTLKTLELAAVTVVAYGMWLVLWALWMPRQAVTLQAAVDGAWERWARG